jgi:hypothetical protein
MPQLSFSTLAIGARQLVVQEALETCLALVGGVVDAHDEHRGVVLRRGRHDHALRAGLDVPFGLGLLQEETGAFQHVFGADVAPLQVRGIALGGEADLLAVDDQRALGGLDRALERAVNGVILQHVRQLRGVEQIVDAHDLDIRMIRGRAEHQPADASKSIDAHLDRHVRVAWHSVRTAGGRCCVQNSDCG